MDYSKRHSRGKKAIKQSAFNVFLRDIILFVIALNVFALFHHVLPRKLQPVDASRYATATPTPAEQGSPSTTARSLAASPR